MRLLSTRELSDALGVSESSLKRWIDGGRIIASRTSGGHRRIAIDDALRFIRETSAPIVRPELLGLPQLASPAASERTRLYDLLIAGDTSGAKAWLVARYLAGASVAELGDGPIREAMHGLGELWRHDHSRVHVEHRGTDACLQAIAAVRALLPEPSAKAALAIGGAPSGDPYLAPSQLAAMVATEAGLRADNLGPDLPAAALQAAVAEQRPKLVWLSVSTVLPETASRALVRALDALPRSTTIIVGGQHAAQLPRSARITRVTTLRELADHARAVKAAA